MHGRGHLSVLVPVNVDSLEDGRAAQIEALDAGSVPVAVETRLGQALLQSRVYVHQGTIYHLEHYLILPQGAVQVNPTSNVVVDQNGSARQRRHHLVRHNVRRLFASGWDANCLPVKHFRQLVFRRCRFNVRLFSGHLLEVDGPVSETSSFPFRGRWDGRNDSGGRRHGYQLVVGGRAQRLGGCGGDDAGGRRAGCRVGAAKHVTGDRNDIAADVITCEPVCRWLGMKPRKLSQYPIIK